MLTFSNFPPINIAPHHSRLLVVSRYPNRQVELVRDFIQSTRCLDGNEKAFFFSRVRTRFHPLFFKILSTVVYPTTRVTTIGVDEQESSFEVLYTELCYLSECYKPSSKHQSPVPFFPGPWYLIPTTFAIQAVCVACNSYVLPGFKVDFIISWIFLNTFVFDRGCSGSFLSTPSTMLLHSCPEFHVYISRFVTLWDMSM